MLESNYYAYKKEQVAADKKSSEEDREKVDLLIQLENSRSFTSTHAAIEKLRRVTAWTSDERETLFVIAVNNSQVFYILGDLDIKSFYQRLLKECHTLSANAQKVKEALEKE